MGIIVKYILKSIFEKKFRTFIIVFSVTLSAALFFASSGMSGTMKSMYETQFKMQTGKADLIIHANRHSPSSSFKLRPEPVGGVTLLTGDVSASGSYKLPEAEAQAVRKKAENLRIRGFEMDELEQLNPIDFTQHAVGRDFQGNHIILSTLFAEKHGFAVGDRIDIEINGHNRMLTVWGISRPTGIFQHTPQSDTMMAVMPRDSLASLFDIRGRVQTAYVVLDDEAEIQSVQESLSILYPRYTVREPFSAEELENYLQFIVVPLFMMTTMVLFISIFIIYSTFKVIAVERLPVIGTFRSIGATKRMTDTVLIGESLTYGLLGGVLGNFVGIGILYLITRMMASDPYSGQMNVAIEFSFSHMLIAFLLAIGVALISSWIPISKASKIPIKDLVLNTTQGKSGKKTWKTITAVLLFTLAILLPRVAPKSLALAINVFSLLVSTMAVIMFVPFITKVFLKVFERLYGFIFGNEGILAVKNLNGNKNILNNISLLAIGISTLLMINTISHSVGIEVISAYNDWKFEIMVGLNDADRNAEQVLRSIEGVSGTYGAFESWEGINVVDTSYRVEYLQGVDITKYRDYVTFRLDGDANPDETFRNLDEARNIMVANMAKEHLDLEIGDPLTLEMTSGNKTYRIIGFYDSIMQNGSNMIISQKYYKMDMEQSNYNRFYIRTSKDPDEVMASIQDRFMRRGVWGDTIANMEQRNYDSNNQFMIILQAFSVIAMLIGIFGIFNNYMISFIERKRSIAILRSVGLSRKQTLKMIMIEALTGGCIGGIMGIIGGTLMLSPVPHLMQAIGVPLALHYSWSFFINSLMGGIIIAVLASISPASKTSKLNIIDAIKYE
ncbi:protein of unknown function DUF214 [Alkaliphilus metalliredigens QYMF]|uniref:ABC3 transporter permease protein domain-containing protein n=1 Tax=Alkaliphilus metalliredigens (strain QYMF) TaxID=293826 RepID=A6TSQ0_ALKMQ|nr:FtsX-like permease family protein [Alkaliphilus metalliredigens]ABR49218.1 protein of unknown function DUF214 [Alkaliphilus metalliredigens QYMF]